MQLDFVRGTLPWAPGTADEIIGLHVIEHMLRPDGLILMKRVYELLKPGAGVTISCPDLHKLCVKYLREDEQFWARRYGRTGKEIWPGDTLADRLNEAMHQQGHLWSYDLNSLTCLAVHAGWKNVRPMPLTSRYSVRKDHETGIVCVKE